MQDKRLTIITEATSLFSEKGFHATSMQEVADRSHVSKGTIYTYFSSKEDLLLSIFKFFQENIQRHLEGASQSDLNAQEKFVQQIYILLRESLIYKAFFKMQHREQLISSQKSIQTYLMQSRFELFKWYESLLKQVYGEALEPYLTECTLLLDSIITGFLRFIMINEDVLDLEKAATYIAKRVDNMVQAMLSEKETPILPNALFDQMKNQFIQYDIENETNVSEVLKKMGQILEQLDLDEDKKKELTNSLLYLEDELKTESPKKFLFKGLLSNFEGIEVLELCRRKIEDLLELS